MSAIHETGGSVSTQRSRAIASSKLLPSHIELGTTDGIPADVKTFRSVIVAPLRGIVKKGGDFFDRVDLDNFNDTYPVRQSGRENFCTEIFIEEDRGGLSSGVETLTSKGKRIRVYESLTMLHESGRQATLPMIRRSISRVWMLTLRLPKSGETLESKGAFVTATVELDGIESGK